MAIFACQWSPTQCLVYGKTHGIFTFEWLSGWIIWLNNQTYRSKSKIKSLVPHEVQSQIKLFQHLHTQIIYPPIHLSIQRNIYGSWIDHQLSFIFSSLLSYLITNQILPTRNSSPTHIYLENPFLLLYSNYHFSSWGLLIRLELLF